MKSLLLFIIFLIKGISVFCQPYYIRGEVRDEAGNIMQNVKIVQHTTGLIFRSGSVGTFGINSRQLPDTLFFSQDGYRSERLEVKMDEFQRVVMKLASVSSQKVRRDNLSSLTKDLSRDVQRKWFTGDETYTSLLENRFVNAEQFPQTGISLNIDRASYSNIRRFISQNSPVPPDAVRVEEMLNYFNLGYQQPDSEKIFNIQSVLTSCPWNKDNQLFFINLSAQKINTDLLPPSHLVFLVDVSGSMEMANRLPLLKSAFRLLVNNLREKDTVSIVVYGGAMGIMLQPTAGNEKEKILKAIDDLVAGGATPGESGIRTAYGLAKHHFIKDGNNRVILATDGDFNVGVKTEEELDQLISQHRESGIYLTCLGVGMGNLKDSKIHLLAIRGKGNYAYIDNFMEAEKVLLKEFTQTLYTVADRVFMNVEFNPDFVKEYRLIGFDNRAGDIADSLTKIEGGEIGSGYSMTGMFEIVPATKNNISKEKELQSELLADINVVYSLPGDSLRNTFNYKTNLNYRIFNDAGRSQRFSAAVVLFGSLLRASPYLKDAGWNELISISSNAVDINDAQQKEFLEMIHKAKNIYTRSKKEKRKNRSDE